MGEGVSIDSLQTIKGNDVPLVPELTYKDFGFLCELVFTLNVYILVPK